MSYYSEATSEVFGTIMAAAQGVGDILNGVKRAKNKSGYLTRSSIMKAAKDLVMSFPVLCTDTISPETANMVVKAIERNCVTTLQLLFSAANLRGEDGMEVLRMWHKNMDNDIGMDDYLDAIDAVSVGLGESGLAMLEAMADKFGNEMVAELVACSTSVYPENSFSEHSLMQFAVKENYGRYEVYTKNDPCEMVNEESYVWLGGKWVPKDQADIEIKVADGIARDNANRKANKEKERANDIAQQANADRRNEFEKNFKQKAQQFGIDHQLDLNKFQHQKDQDAIKNANDREKLDLDHQKFGLDKDKFDHQLRQDDLRNADAEVEYFHKQLLPSDVKKANEMVPSMMIIRFLYSDGEFDRPVYQQFIAGVKARLISVSSMEAIEAIRSTSRSKVNLTNLIRATTKEISFCRDFIAGIDQAKIDAKANSKLAKTSPIWRSLQWRSTKSVMNRLRRRKANDAGAITTLVLTSEEVNFMKSEYNIDVNIPSKAKEIMEQYNLMCLCIVDEEVEVARFLFDGDKYFQDYSFNALERETGDANYKKIINLMSKMNR